MASGRRQQRARIDWLQRSRGASFSVPGRGPRTPSRGGVRRRPRGGLPAGLVAAALLGVWAVDSAGAGTDRKSSVETPSIRLESVMDRLASKPGMRVAFREARHLAVLSEPIRSEGFLFFAPPGDMARYTLHPARSSVIVRGDRVFLEDGTGRQSFDISSNEMAQGLVGNFGILLRGDLLELRRRYVLEFRGSGDSWVLQLQPRSRSLRHLVDRIEVEGQGGELARVVTTETNGDRTVLVFEDVTPLPEIEGLDREKFFHPDFPSSLP